MVEYEFDIVCIEKRLYKGVIVEAENEEEAEKKAKNLDWEECLDEECIDIIEIKDIEQF